MKVSVQGDSYSYIVERGEDPDKIAIHQLSAISGGADPDKVFSSDYHVHHIDKNKWNNGVENLKLQTAEEHSRNHATERRGISLPMDEVIDMYLNEHVSTTQLADKYDCSPETIANKLRKSDISLRDNSDRFADKPWDNPDTIRDLYHSKNMSAPEIGNKLGCSGTTIYNRMKRFDIPRR